MADIKNLEKLARFVRYYILRMTTKAGSGHLTSALSATDIMVALFFGKFRFDLENIKNIYNDRIIFSKGHASPLLYALYGAAGVLKEKELDKYRTLNSPLEGHPTAKFKYAEIATGSLGQGLSVGVGMALYAKVENLPYITYVLMGDSEFAEGSVWEAIEVASYYKLDNLVGIIDVNRLGQSGETMLGWDVDTYKKRVEAFGWQVQTIDGHNLAEICKVFDKIKTGFGKPQMVIAKTIKGKGVSFLEDQEGWHGLVLKDDDFKKAVAGLGKIDRSLRGQITKPDKASAGGHLPSAKRKSNGERLVADYKIGEMVATRRAYGETLTRLGDVNQEIVALDGEVKNSTFAELFAKKFPDRYFEMFIAEQNMVGVALGLSKRGKIPFVSTFAAFFTRAYDQIRMSAYSEANVKFVGSHAGVSIGEDGPSQMGLEDIAMFRAVYGSKVFCPVDAVSCARLVELAAQTEGLFYIRTARPPTPVIYKNDETFEIGGSKVLRKSASDQLTIVACGVVLIEAIKAADELLKQKINVRVIDAYSIKPIDEDSIKSAAFQTNNLIITVEDHYFEGGFGDAVLNVFAQDDQVKVYKLAVNKLPMSGKSHELLDYEGISSGGIINKVKEILA